MTKLFASTAIAIALATTAYGQAETPFVPSITAQAHYASDLIGARLYASEAEVDETAGMNQDWDDVGEIHDIIVGNDGEIVAVLVDIGGFLGIGEKQVAVSMDSLNFVRDGENADDYFVVINTSQDMLDNAPTFEWQGDDMNTTASMSEQTAETEVADNDAAVTTEAPQSEETNLTQAAKDSEAVEEADAAADRADDTAMAENDTSADPSLGSSSRDYRFTPPAIEMEGYETATVDKLTTEDVEGARVYDAKDEWIGEVQAIEMDESGKLGDAIIDVGGFLGIGEKRVAVNFDEMTLQRRSDSGELRFYVDATKEQLEQLPESEM